MAHRTFNQFKLAATNTPQPMAGSWITAGLTAPILGNTPTVITLGTATSSGNDATNIFLQSEPALLINASGTNRNAEAVMITKVSGNTVTIGPAVQGGGVTQFSHVSGVAGTGTWIIPNGMANNAFLQLVPGNSAVMYLGSAYNMTATFRVIVSMLNTPAAVQPIEYGAGMGFFGNPFLLSERWCYGAANDSWLASFLVI